jgi:hypothetical protein
MLCRLRPWRRRDEERFGLEYDLDVYNIVAVSDFNMGGPLPAPRALAHAARSPSKPCDGA